MTDRPCLPLQTTQRNQSNERYRNVRLWKGMFIMLQRHSTFLNVVVFLVGVFVPIVGHILDTILILRDDHSWLGKALWLAVVWLFPFVGALLYMLFGRR